MTWDVSSLPTPCYVVDEDLLTRNLELLASVSTRTGCKILLAQKAFSLFALYPLMGQYLHGTTASSLFEARLGKEEMGGECHIFSAAYTPRDFPEILSVCDHIVFNSVSQWKHYRPLVTRAECGLRVNPEYAEVDTPLYNPCAPGSRLGVRLCDFIPAEFDDLHGLHFHTMCEQNADTLQRTLRVFEDKFGCFIPGLRWVNFGGGHHITRDDYDSELLIRCVSAFQDKYGVQVYLEPGEAVALNTGFLAARVLDIVRNGIDIAILDASAACHMPDVLEMPYMPRIVGAEPPGVLPYTFRLAGPTCLAGDVIGDYSFTQPLAIGDTLLFCDMAHYTMVKNNTFNGINLPAITTYSRAKGLRTVRQFGYEDFKTRLS